MDLVKAMEHVLGVAKTDEPQVAQTVEVDLGKVQHIVNSLVAAAPKVQAGLVETGPFVSAIAALISKGAPPTPEEWAAIASSLDGAVKGAEQVQAAASEVVQTAETELEAPAVPNDHVEMPGDHS